MKFRGVISNTIPMRYFYSIVTSLSKISKEAVLRITSNSIHFIISEDCGASATKVWCDLDQTSFFSEYNMEGVDNIHKDIYLGFVTVNLAKSLITLKQTAKCIKIKLSNKHCPCLTLEIELPAADLVNSRQLVHDVPVTVIPRKMWSTYNEPTSLKYHVSLILPELKNLKCTVDHMRNMSTNLILKANNQGQLILQIKTDMVTVSSRFKNIVVENFNELNAEEDEVDDEDDSFVICHIDIKKFLMFLSADQISHNRVICNISHNKTVNLLLENEGIMKFQCFIPSICC